MSEIERLGLEQHPEGGWFRETWRSPVEVTLPDGRTRATATLIHFFLPAGESSAWHVVASDELWIAQSGAVGLELAGAGSSPVPTSSGAPAPSRPSRRCSCRPGCGSAPWRPTPTPS